MDNERADKLINLLEQLVEVLKPQPEALPTLEEAVEARVKNLFLERGIAEVFDKMNSDEAYHSVRDLINRKTHTVAAHTLDAIEKTVGDPEYKAQRQKEVEAAIKKALEEKEQLEAKNE